MTCSLCDRPVYVKQEMLCCSHYLKLRKYGDPLAEPKAPKPVGVAELKARTQFDGDCWVWTSTLTNGYGVIGVGGRAKNGGRLWLAHRLMYELAVGPLPDGLVLHHTCHERSCLNPAHLEPMTRAAHQRIHRVGWTRREVAA